MYQLEQILQQVKELLAKLHLHPLVVTLGILFCVFFPRFFLLSAFGYGVYWVATNIWGVSWRSKSRREKDKT